MHLGHSIASCGIKEGGGAITALPHVLLDGSDAETVRYSLQGKNKGTVPLSVQLLWATNAASGFKLI